MPSQKHTLNGASAAILAYLLWGLFPIYWKQLHGIAATELIAHRVVWSLAFVAVLTFFTGAWAELKPALTSPAKLGLHLASGTLLSINWLTYVWA